MAKGVSPRDRKSGVEPQRRMDRALCLILSTPAAALVPNVLVKSAFSLDPTSKVESEVLLSGHCPPPPYLLPRLVTPWRGHSTA